jgi:hypothetical protein
MQKLVDALLGQRKQKEYQIGSSKVVLQTLTAGEQTDVSRIIGSRNLDFASQAEVAKIPVLARSLVSINGVVIDAQPEVREKLRGDPMLTSAQAIEQVLSDFDWGIIDHLFSNCYSDLVQDRAKELETLKNSSRDRLAESSGKSAPSSEQPQVA